MIELTHKRKWDSKTFDTGRINDKELPIYAATLQNGLHDIEPDGSYVEVVNRFRPYVGNVSTDEVTRNRGKVKISDTGSESKDRVKITTKRDCGVSLKLKGYRTYGPHFDTLKDTYYTTDNGITLRYYPNHKGVNIIVEVANPATASNVFRFTIREYGCSYTYEKIEGGIKCISSTGEDDIFIKALYVIDANGEYGSVDIFPDGVDVDGYQIVKKVVDPVWLGNAVGPVRIDPSVTIDDTTGTFEDSSLFTNTVATRDWNNGAYVFAQVQDGFTTLGYATEAMRVDLSAYSGYTILNGKYTINVSVIPASAFDYGIYPILQDWNEGNKSNATADANQITGKSAMHGNALTDWNTYGCQGSGTDHSATEAGSGTFPLATGLFDMPLTAQSIQDKIDGTNYGDIVKPKTPTSTNRFIRWDSSEGTIKPSLYFEYTTGAFNGFPFFYGAGHY